MLTRDEFAGLSQSTFAVQAEDGRQSSLVLEEVSELKQLRTSEHFSLSFRGPNEACLAQGVYRFSHHTAGEMELFIVPIGGDATGFLYEAIFNRLRSAEASTADQSQ